MKRNSTNKKGNKKWGVLIQLLFGGVIGLFGSVFILDNIDISEWSLQKVLSIVLFFFIAIFININIHEFGHFLFGKMNGYRLISYRVSFLTWNNENGEMKFSIQNNKGYGGLCAMIPIQQEIAANKQLLFYAGGIILNFVTGIIFLLPVVFSTISETLNLFLLILSFFAFFSAIVNLLPFFSGGYLPTDGKIIWSIVLKQPFSIQLMEANKIVAQLSAGVRPRDLQFSNQFNSNNPQMVDMSILLYSYFKASDSQDLQKMVYYSKLLEENIEVFPGMSLPSLYYELCYLGCLTENHDQAVKYYKKAGKILQNDKDVNGLRVKAYYEYYIKKDVAVAKEFCDKAIAVADKFPIKGQGIMELELVKSLKKSLMA